jgi:hypothetical protein
MSGVVFGFVSLSIWEDIAFDVRLDDGILALDMTCDVPTGTTELEPAWIVCGRD